MACSCSAVTAQRNTIPWAETDPETLRYEVGERCEIEYKGEWFGGRIEALGRGKYTVSWDGYASSFNSEVGAERLRPLRPLPGIPYVVVRKEGGAVRVSGDLSAGKPIDLTFASRSNNACFPDTRFAEFEGNHVFYWFDLPEQSEATLRVSAPGGQRINIYGFSGFDGSNVPPALNSCVSCEAGHEWWNPIDPPRDFSRSAGEQSIQLRATTNRFRVLVGIAGARGVSAGAYELSLELKSFP